MIHIPEELVREVKVVIAHLKMTMSAYIKEAILDRLERDVPKVEAMKE